MCGYTQQVAVSPLTSVRSDANQAGPYGVNQVRSIVMFSEFLLYGLFVNHASLSWKLLGKTEVMTEKDGYSECKINADFITLQAGQLPCCICCCNRSKLHHYEASQIGPSKDAVFPLALKCTRDDVIHISWFQFNTAERILDYTAKKSWGKRQACSYNLVGMCEKLCLTEIILHSTVS